MVRGWFRLDREPYVIRIFVLLCLSMLPAGALAQVDEQQSRHMGDQQCLSRIDHVLRSDQVFIRDNMQFNLINRGGTKVLRAVGAVGRQDAERLASVLRQHGDIDEIWFHSPGGVAIQGPAMGRVIRQAGIPTRIVRGDVCFSACTYAFLGGPLRYIDEGGCYGSHMFSRYGSGANTVVEDIVGASRRFGNDSRGFSSWMRTYMQDIEKRAAQVARDQARFLREMSVSDRFLTYIFDTDAPDAFFFRRNQLIELQIENGIR
jgi:hypothetical protein